MSGRPDPPVGLVRWMCGYHCTTALLVGGDIGDDRGWDRVREHRATVGQERKATMAEHAKPCRKEKRDE